VERGYNNNQIVLECGNAYILLIRTILDKI
jgi:hypothetical protein